MLYIITRLNDFGEICFRKLFLEELDFGLSALVLLWTGLGDFVLGHVFVQRSELGSVILRRQVFVVLFDITERFALCLALKLA